MPLKENGQPTVRAVIIEPTIKKRTKIVVKHHGSRNKTLKQLFLFDICLRLLSEQNKKI